MTNDPELLRRKHEAGDDYDGADSIDGFDHGGVPEALDNALRSL